MKLTDARVVVFLLLVCAVSHLRFIPFFDYLLTCEWAVFLQGAQEIARGNFLVYPFQQQYGGMTFEYVRAFFIKILPWFETNSIHAFVSYLVEPSLMTVVSYFCLRQVFSIKEVLPVAFVCAVGFPFWIFNYGNDFYITYYILGFLFLALRPAQFSYLNTGRKTMILSGVVCGHLIYTSPIAWIFCAAFLLSESDLKSGYRSFIRYKNHKKVLWLSCVFVVIYTYLEIRDRVLFSWNDFQIKSNTRIFLYLGLAFPLALVLWQKRGLLQTFLKQTAFFTLGFLFGFSPALYFNWSNRGKEVHQTILQSTNFAEIGQLIKNIPARMESLLLFGFDVSTYYKPEKFLLDSDWPYHLFFIPCALLVFFCSIAGLYLYRLQNKKFSEKSFPFIASIVFTFLFYFGFRTWVVPMGPARYLFPAFPAFLIGITAWFKVSFEKKSQIWMRSVSGTMFLILTLSSSLYLQTIKSTEFRSGRMSEIRKSIDWFQHQKVKVVISSSIMHTNNFTLIANQNVFFWSFAREWGLPRARELAHQEKRVGLILSPTDPLITEGHVVNLGPYQYTIHGIKRVHELVLALGERTKL